MSNTIYSEQYQTYGPTRTPLSGSYHNTIQSPSSSNSQNFKYTNLTKKEQLRQINSVMRQKINYMTNQFSTIQKSYVKNTGLGRTVVGQRLLVQRENSLQNKKQKNTISTQFGQIYVDQIEPQQSLLTYDSCILSQKSIKQKILNTYELIQKYENANQNYKLNIQLQEYGKFYKIKGLQNRQYAKKYYNNKGDVWNNSSIKTKQYLKPNYISYTDECNTERKKQQKYQLKDNYQLNHKRVDILNQNNQLKQNKITKEDKAIYKAIQDRIVTSSCIFNQIPMSTDKFSTYNLAARMHKQTIQRQSLIDQLSRSHKKT